LGLVASPIAIGWRQKGRPGWANDWELAGGVKLTRRKVLCFPWSSGVSVRIFKSSDLVFGALQLANGQGRFVPRVQKQVIVGIRDVFGGLI
jgi:hypothetical protein